MAGSSSNEQRLAQMVELLSGSSRRERQTAASGLALLTKEAPVLLLPFGDALVDALNRPEAQTRWECLDMLTRLVDLDSDVCDKAVAGAEMSLFDEGSGPVRLAAMRFLCKLGATSEERSDTVWPLIDEGIQCYHGDYEYQDMLAAVIEFAGGRLSARVRTELAARMAFDASNGKGALKRRSQQVLDNLQAS